MWGIERPKKMGAGQVASLPTDPSNNTHVCCVPVLLPLIIDACFAFHSYLRRGAIASRAAEC